MGYFLF